MKIVYVVGGLLTPNGMSQVLSQKINWLAENTDYELYMILTEKAREPLFYKISPKVKCINFNINFDELDTMPIHQKIIHYIRKQRKYKKKFHNYLMKLKPDITISTIRREINFINSIPDGSLKIGEIHFNRSNYREFNKSFLPKWVNRLITQYWRRQLLKELNKLAVFITLSQEDAIDWKADLDNLMVIPNPLAYYPEKSSTCENKKVIAVGRYTYQKGFDILIEIWERISVKYPDWELNIYGSGDSTPYQQLIKEKKLHKHIRCHPATNDIYNKYTESSIFAFTSRYEGFGLVLAEAMSCGLPCVAFACPCGPKDIINEGEDGFLSSPGNTLDFTTKLGVLIRNEEMRKTMGQKAKENISRFKEENIMKQWVELFERIKTQ